MKSIIVLLALLALIRLESYAQTADDILNNGIVVKKSEKIFLKLDTAKTLLFEVGKKVDPLDFTKYENKSYFLVKKNAVNIYMQPINPLNLAINSEIVSRIDPLNSALDTALKGIYSQFNKIDALNKANIAERKKAAITTKRFKDTSICGDCCFNNFINSSKQIVGQLDENQKTKIAKIFSKLKAMTFNLRDSTKTSIDNADSEIKSITVDYKDLKNKLEILKDSLNAFKCTDQTQKFVLVVTGTTFIKDISAAIDDQEKRFTLLKTTYNLVLDAYNKANTDPSLPWFVLLRSAPARRDSISDVNLQVNKTGFELSTDKEISATKLVTLKKYTLSVRKFEWFVPEVSAGIVYSDVSYPKYGTATDASGKITVADGGSDNVSKFSVASMINLNLFISNSFIHPFIQAGVGTSTDYAALFLGAGIKISDKLSFSVGGASPWVKKLKTLKIGDTVTGTADIDKDTEYNFKGFYRIYYGLQYKL